MSALEEVARLRQILIQDVEQVSRAMFRHSAASPRSGSDLDAAGAKPSTWRARRSLALGLAVLTSAFAIWVWWARPNAVSFSPDLVAVGRPEGERQVLVVPASSGAPGFGVSLPMADDARAGDPDSATTPARPVPRVQDPRAVDGARPTESTQPRGRLSGGEAAPVDAGNAARVRVLETEFLVTCTDVRDYRGLLSTVAHRTGAPMSAGCDALVMFWREPNDGAIRVEWAEPFSARTISSNARTSVSNEEDLLRLQFELWRTAPWWVTARAESGDARGGARAVLWQRHGVRDGEPIELSACTVVGEPLLLCSDELSDPTSESDNRGRPPLARARATIAGLPLMPMCRPSAGGVDGLDLWVLLPSPYTSSLDPEFWSSIQEAQRGGRSGWTMRGRVPLASITARALPGDLLRGTAEFESFVEPQPFIGRSDPHSPECNYTMPVTLSGSMSVKNEAGIELAVVSYEGTATYQTRRSDEPLSDDPTLSERLRHLRKR